MLELLQNIFYLITNFFNFINDIIFNVREFIVGATLIINSLLELFIRITRLLPLPLYQIFLVFLYLYVAIFIYKIIRKG